MTDDFDELIECGYHPVFSVQDGSCVMESGCVYEIWFRNPPVPRLFPVLGNEQYKKYVYNHDVLTYLYKTEEEIKDSVGVLIRHRFHFLFDSVIIYFGTTIRQFDPYSVRTYMFFFRKII